MIVIDQRHTLPLNHYNPLLSEFGRDPDRDTIRHYSQHKNWEVLMSWPEAVLEILHVLQTMSRWMAGMVLVVVLLLAQPPMSCNAAYGTPD